MNERQKKFCELYAANPNATEAAKAAGYSTKTAYAIGQRLLKNVETKKYIDELTNGAKSERIATVRETLEYLTDVMRNPDELTRERTKAAQQLIAILNAEQANAQPNAVQIIVERKIVDLSKNNHGGPDRE